MTDPTAPDRALLVALLTPFDARGRVDLARLRVHVLWLCARGVDGFVPTVAAGEFLYLSDREREAIHRTVLDAARGKLVLPGTWDPSPATMTFLTEAARDHGAAGVVLLPPIAVELDDRLIRAWYETAARKDVPVLVYSDRSLSPGTGGGPISPELYHDLRRTGLVAGLVEATDDGYRIGRWAANDRGAVWCAGDRLLGRAGAVPDLRGVVTTIGNAWPDFCRRLYHSGEEQLEDALAQRLARLQAAGGIRALKGLLGMPCRAPLLDVLPAELAGLPPAELP